MHKRWIAMAIIFLPFLVLFIYQMKSINLLVPIIFILGLTYTASNFRHFANAILIVEIGALIFMFYRPLIEVFKQPKLFLSFDFSGIFFLIVYVLVLLSIPILLYDFYKSYRKEIEGKK